MKNILVTGGYGFIGSNYCSKYVDSFDKLVIVDKKCYSSNVKNIQDIINNEKVVRLEEDIISCNFIEIFKKYDINYVIHFAAQTHVDNSYDNFTNFIYDNIIATYILLEQCKKYPKLEKILMMSTDEIYGPSLVNELDENSNFNPTNPYAASKASAEMIINTFKHSYSLPIIIIRCNNVYGPKQHIEKVIPKFISQILNRESITIHGNGNKQRDFIFVDDVCNAIHTILLKGIVGEIYNIGCDNSISIKKLAEYLINKLGNTKIVYIEDRPYNDNRYFLNCDKIKSLGWRNLTNWDTGIEKTIVWLKENKNYWEYNNNVKIKSIKNYNDIGGSTKLLNNINVEMIKEQLLSINKKNVIRGIHCCSYSRSMVCIKGSIVVYVIDIYNNTYKKYCLNENSKIYIPENKGYLSITLEEDTQILYQIEGIFDYKEEKNINYRDPYINLDIDWNNEYIISDKDLNSDFTKSIDYVILGSTGYLGSYTCKFMDKLKKNYVIVDTRLQNMDLIYKKLATYKPKYVICAAGICSKLNNTDWCENNEETIYNINYMSQIKLSKICKELEIHLTIFGTGLVYNKEGCFSEYDKTHDMEKYYSQLKILLENDLDYSNVLYLRFHYPISGDNNDRCLVSKILNKLNSIHDVYINCTFLPELIPKMFEMIECNTIGKYNFVNPGLITIPEIINILDSNIKYKITHVNKIRAELNTNKLLSLFPEIRSIQKCITDLGNTNIWKCIEKINCRCCNSYDLECILDLGMQPLANSYHKNKDDILETFPLKLILCKNCYHLQLSHVVNPTLMFKNYLYISGISNTINNYFNWFADFTISKHKNKSGTVLEIACNDGSQLDKFKNKGWITIGVDPAENIYEISSQKGHTIYCGFWDSKISNDIIKNHNTVDLIVAQNVFAHLDNVDNFLFNCKKIMNDNTLLFIQTSQANMLINNEYDTIYHEHLSFFSINSMNVLVKRMGLFLNNVTKTNIHGTSFIFEISKLNDPKNTEDLLLEEYKYLYDSSFYYNYRQQCLDNTNKLVYAIKMYKSNNYKIISYGASAKGNTILNFIKDDYVDYIVDDNNLKCGLYTPGTNILIKPSDSLREEKNKIAILMLTWNFEKEIKNKISSMDLNNEVKYIQYA